MFDKEPCLFYLNYLRNKNTQLLTAMFQYEARGWKSYERSYDHKMSAARSTIFVFLA